jgi:phosphopantothenate synthetase
MQIRVYHEQVVIINSIIRSLEESVIDKNGLIIQPWHEVFDLGEHTDMPLLEAHTGIAWHTFI